jgi:hypothetical protein
MVIPARVGSRGLFCEGDAASSALAAKRAKGKSDGPLDLTRGPAPRRIPVLRRQLAHLGGELV